MPIGNVLYNPPDVMKVGIKDRVEARVSKNADGGFLRSLKGRGIPHTETTVISELMKVRLSGDDFYIINLNEGEQVIGEVGYSEWAWDVLPKKSGKKHFICMSL